MKLGEWLKKEQMSPIVFAVSCGVSLRQVYRYIKGDYIPKVFTVRRITKFTNGEVTPEDMGLIDGKKPKTDRPINSGSVRRIRKSKNNNNLQGDKNRKVTRGDAIPSNVNPAI